MAKFLAAGVAKNFPDEKSKRQVPANFYSLRIGAVQESNFKGSEKVGREVNYRQMPDQLR